MKQFWVFILQALYTVIANMIDDGFANRMGIDTVVAYGSFLPIVWTVQSFNNIGKYAYTNTMKHAKTCLGIGLAMTFIVMGGTIPCYRLIGFLYDLSPVQMDIFNKLVLCYLITVPLRTIGDFLYLDLMYQFENKKIIISDILFWVTNICLDTVVFVFKFPSWCLVLTTAVAYFLYDIYLVRHSGILKERFQLSAVRELLKHGFNIVFDRIVGRVASLTYCSLASKMPENKYAIHCVVYLLISNTEEFTNNFNIYCRARLDGIKKKILPGSNILLKKYGALLIVIEYAFSIIFLAIYHGDVSFSACLPWLFVYLTDSISLLLYENRKAALGVYSKTEYLRYGGLIGVLTRVPYTFLAYYLDWGLFGFGTACTLDFLARAIYLNVMIKKYENNQQILREV